METNKPKPQQDIPKKIIKTAKLLEALSPNLATSFAYKLFVTPINHKAPKREEEMEKGSIQKYIDIPSIKKKIRVFEYGESDKKALLVHGWSGRGTQLVSIANALRKEGYMTISFDAPAHGKSEGKISHMLMFIECIFELQKIYGKFDLSIGHSLGGMSVMNAIKRGFVTEKAITIGSGDIVSDIFDGFVESLQLKKTISLKLKSKFEKRLKNTISDFDVYKAAKTASVPVFVIHDTQDKDVPVLCAHHIHEHLLNGELLITDRLGHRKILGDTQVINQIIAFATKE